MSHPRQQNKRTGGPPSGPHAKDLPWHSYEYCTICQKVSRTVLDFSRPIYTPQARWHIKSPTLGFQSRHQSPNDSVPGEPPSVNHGGDRSAQPALDPGAAHASQASAPYLPPTEDGPYIPTHTEGHATSINSAIRSTTSPFPHQRALSQGSEYGNPVRDNTLAVHSRSNSLPKGSPTGSVHSDQSASLSAHSGYSHQSGQSGSSSRSLDLQPQPVYPQVYQGHEDHDGRFGMAHGFSAHAAPSSQHYYRMGDDGFQGVLAPEVLHADDDIHTPSDWDLSQLPGDTSHGSPPLYSLSSSSTSSTPASLHAHLPIPGSGPPSPSLAEQYLRLQLGLPHDKPVDLWALKDPPDRAKPSQPYPNLIKLAIFGSPTKKLTLQEIYKELIDRFEWFRDNKHEMAWKNSIRHNLSLNKVFVNIPRPITEPGKGSYWRLDLSQGEGYKRPRIRKSRAQLREAKKLASGEVADTEAPEEVSPNPSSATGRSSGSAGSTDEANIDPQLRDQGHIVGRGRVRSTRRTDTTSPYPLRKTPSPTMPVVSLQQEQQLNVPCSYATDGSPRSLSLSPLQIPRDLSRPQLSVPVGQQPQYDQQLMGRSMAQVPLSQLQQRLSQPSFGQPSAPQSAPVQTGLPWISQSTASPVFTPDSTHTSTSPGAPCDSPVCDHDRSLEFFADDGLPRARRPADSASRPGSHSPPDRDDWGRQRVARGTTR